MFRKIVYFCFVFLGIIPLQSALADASLVKFGNGEEISKTDLDDYLSGRPDLIATVRNAYGAENALREMAMTRVLVLEGTEKYVPRVGEDQGKRFDDRYGLVVYKTLASACPRPATNEEERAYFLGHPDAFKVPVSVRLTRIMLPRNQSIDGIRAQEKMTQWARDWSLKKISIEQIASDAEKAYDKEVQGDVGWVTLEGTEELSVMRSLASANNGELVGPVVEGDYIYLFLIKGKYESRQLSWDEAKNLVSQRAVTYCRQKDAHDIKNRLFEKYGVEIQGDQIKKLFSD